MRESEQRRNQLLFEIEKVKSQFNMEKDALNL